MKNRGIQTVAIHGGEKPDGKTGASAPNIVMSSTFVVDEPMSFSATNIDDDSPYVYTRWSNPTIRQLEEKLALLENTEDCLALASGMAASTGVLLTQLNPGDHLIISNTNYPGTAELARDHLPARGVDVTPVDTSDLASVENAMRPNTRMIWVETPSNPLLRITDIAAVAKIARSNQALLAVDSTFATPIGTCPIDLGSDLVIHSLTKYIGGHGDALGGAIIGGKALISSLRGDGVLHYGATISPFNAFMMLQGLETLPLRMERHVQNAEQVTEFLKGHQHVSWVKYAGDPDNPYYDLGRKYLPKGAGSVLTFGIKGGLAAGARFIENVQFLSHLANVGDAKTLVIHPSSTTHRQLNEEEQSKAGVSQDMIRISVGLEAIKDILWDIDQALEASQQ